MTEAPALIGIHEPRILTVDNGGTNTRIAQYVKGRVVTIEAYKTPKKYDQAIGELSLRTARMLDGHKPDAVGFSLAGKIENGRIVQAGELQKNGWVDLPFIDDVAGEFGISPDSVIGLNDCAAGANAERKAHPLLPGKLGAFFVLSTGFGGALYSKDRLISDEPGHENLKPGAICGDGADGHIEAHISGSGIARKYGISGEDLPHSDPRWREIKGDFADAMENTLTRYKREHSGMTLGIVGFTGAVVLGGPNMIGDLQSTLNNRIGEATPFIGSAAYGDESGLYGAAFAAFDHVAA